MKHIKVRSLILFGIIIIVALSFVIEVHNRNLAQKTELKTGLENLSQTIKDGEDRLTITATDTLNTSPPYLAIQSTLKITVDSAKKIDANPNHTLKEITKSSNKLSTALGVFDNSPVLNASGPSPTLTTPDTADYRLPNWIGSLLKNIWFNLNWIALLNKIPVYYIN